MSGKQMLKYMYNENYIIKDLKKETAILVSMWLLGLNSGTKIFRLSFKWNQL